MQKKNLEKDLNRIRTWNKELLNSYKSGDTKQLLEVKTIYMKYNSSDMPIEWTAKELEEIDKAVKKQLVKNPKDPILKALIRIMYLNGYVSQIRFKKIKKNY